MALFVLLNHGVVLSHRMEDDSERHISVAPRTLALAEKQNSELETEALSVVWGVNKFHSYMFGRHIVINNDHKPLEGLLLEDKPVPSMASGRIQRWALALSAYEYTFKYKSGEKMGNAVAMIRLPLSHEPTDVPMPAHVVCLLEFIDSSPIVVIKMRYRLVFAYLLAQGGLSSDRTSVDKWNCPFRVVAYSGGTSSCPTQGKRKSH